MKNQFSVFEQPISIRFLNSIPTIGWTWGYLVVGLTALTFSSHAWGQCTEICDSPQLDTGIGYQALADDAGTGSDNTAFGAAAAEDIGASSAPFRDTAIGAYALQECFDNDNIGFGAYALSTVGDGTSEDPRSDYNTAVGNYSLNFSIYGYYNTAVGNGTFFGPGADGNNTAEGYMAMGYASSYEFWYVSQSNENTALGAEAFEGVPDDAQHKCFDDTAVGFQALYTAEFADTSTSTGSYSLVSNNAGLNNTADGSGALFSDIESDDNTAVGNYALGANTGPDDIGLGYNAGEFLTTGTNNIDIGNNGVAAESNSIRIGTSGFQLATFIAGIRGVVVTGGQPVVVNSSGQLGVTGSSARFKEAIVSMDKKSESILALRPVSFRYKKELDPKGAPQFGLIAEEVAKVDPDLVVTDEAGKPFSVRYEEVNAMLLNEFLKEHRRVAEQEKISEQQTATLDEQTATINELRQVLAQRQVQIKALSSKLQKVNSKLQMALPTARVVTND